MRNLLFSLLLLICGSASAQMVGGNAFLQGQFLEIGVDNMGALGACNAPAGYHPHTSSFGTSVNLAEVYDYGHDGWTVGSPAFMGDYTIPGVPSEGWSIQIGATEYRNWATSTACTGTFQAPGTITGYSNTGGNKIGVWTGTAGGATGVSIVQEARVDTQASAVVFTVHLKNLGATPTGTIYYERMCDPDNTSSWSITGVISGGPTTNNLIEHQNEDLTHRVVVSATGTQYVSGTGYVALPYTYMAYGTKDCRAKAGVLTGGLYPSSTPATLWGGSGINTTLGFANQADVCILLLYNLGSLAAAGSPGDTTSISYTMFFNGGPGIDSALADPVLAINSTPFPGSPAPTADVDTLHMCAFPGVTTFNANVWHGDTLQWSDATWTWAPSAGLSSTTGVTNTINTSLIAGTVTYTITGTKTVSCLNKVFYLTVVPCTLADNNRPCYGDTLRVYATGDTTGATYQWFGPLPSTAMVATSHQFTRYPATYADSGVYYVVKTVGALHDTDSTRVIIRPRPIVTAGSNMALCAPVAPDLNLTVNLFDVGEVFSWSGPNAFTSALQNPTISPFALADTGTYTVIGTTIYGCKDTGSVFVYPGTTAPFSFAIHHGCSQDTVTVFNSGTNADHFTWDFGDGTTPVTTSSTASIQHVYTSQNVYNVTLTAYNTHCSSSVSHVVDTRHSVTAEFGANNDTLCVGSSTSLVDMSTATVQPVGGQVVAWAWDFADGSAIDNTQNPTHTYTASGIYPVMLTATDSIGCVNSISHNVLVLDLKIVDAFTDTTLCLVQPLPLNVGVVPIPYIAWNNYSYAWTPADSLSADNVQVPLFMGFGTFTYTVTAYLEPFHCPATHTLTVHSVEGAKFTDVTHNTTIPYGTSIQLYSNNEMLYMWSPNDGSLTNNNINNPVATPTVTTTYSVFGMDIYGCRDTAYVTITVDSTMSEFIPSGFTPNGDGRNDQFRPVFHKLEKLVEFAVYNRWGVKVFSTSNKDEGWDGNYNGTPQDMGVYFYSIITSRPGYSENQVYKGEITLIR